MTTRDELAALIYGLDLPARYSLDPDESGEIADAILAAFDVTPKSVDTEPPPDETFNAITDWRDPVPGWETAGPTVYRVALALKRASEYDPHAVIHSPPTWFCADCQEFQPQGHEHWPHGLDNT